jgi:hypothetical protein
MKTCRKNLPGFTINSSFFKRGRNSRRPSKIPGWKGFLFKKIETTGVKLKVFFKIPLFLFHYPSEAPAKVSCQRLSP